MGKENKVLFIILISLIFSASGIWAQKYTFSPYSRYGIGDIESRGYGRSTGMGGTGIALRSNEHLNDFNPASYTAMDSSSFFFEAGLKGFYQGFSTTTDNASFSDINFEYFAIGFPLARWGAATLGIRPQSGTGYDFSTIIDDNLLGRTQQSASGSGSITRAYFGIAIQPFKFLSAGLHFSYMWGNLTSLNTIEYLDHSQAISYGRRQNIHVNDIFFDFGLQAVLPLNDNSDLTFGVTFSPKTPLNGYTEELIARGSSIEKEGELFVDADTLTYNKADFKNNALDMPLQYGFGISYNIKNKLSVTVDYQNSAWGDITFPDEFTSTTNRTRYGFGVEYTPNDRNPKTYLSRIRYRLGAHYLNDYLIINNYQLEDFGISFGGGLPLKRSKTSVNLSFEYGKRGTTKYGLVKEDYFRIYLNLTLHEFWFMKQRFE
jgi:hypothetical protein